VNSTRSRRPTTTRSRTPATLCDMCFMTKCPYVPPHEFNVDFPHVMLRYRAVELHEGRIPLQQRELVKTDRNGQLGRRGRATRQLGERSPQHADPPIARKGRGHRPKCRSAQIPRAQFYECGPNARRLRSIAQRTGRHQGAITS